MSMPMPTEGRATLAHSYRNLSEREIRTRLDGPMSEPERVTAKAELLRRNTGDNGPDTTLATGFAPTSAFDLAAPEAGVDGNAAVAARARVWPWMLLVFAVAVAAAGWALRARVLHH